MTTLTETFLKDYEDLLDDEESPSENFEQPMPKASSSNKMEEEIERLKNDFSKEKNEEVSLLVNLPEYVDLIEKVREFSGKVLDIHKHRISPGGEEYNYVLKSNEYASIIDREIRQVHKYVRDIYVAKFPELEQLVLNPLDYVLVVRAIQNETDLNKIDLSHILSGHQIVAINVAGSSTTGKPLKEEELKRCLEACDIVIKLDEDKKKILNFVENRMLFIAPNLSALVTTPVAALMMAAAGGIEALSRMPACNIQVLGSQKKNLLGMSKVGAKLHHGFFANLDIVKKAQSHFQTQLVRMLSTNAAKAARVDFSRLKPDGSIGMKLKDELLKRFGKIQEPPPAKQVKPLVLLDEKPRKKRGGKRYRNMKNKLALTEIRKFKNRMNFGPEAEQEFRSTGVGFGMLGVGTGKVKLNVKDNKISLTQKQKKMMTVNKKIGSGATNGLASSIAFTPVQGMNLVNPEILKSQPKNPEHYFNKETGFKTVIEEKNKGQFLDKLMAQPKN